MVGSEEACRSCETPRQHCEMTSQRLEVHHSCTSTHSPSSVADGRTSWRHMPSGVTSLRRPGLRLHKAEVTTPMVTWRCSEWLRLRAGLRYALRHQRLAGWQLEAAVGHCTSVCLSRRAALTCFYSVCQFIASCHDIEADVWPEVRDELQSFAGLM